MRRAIAASLGDQPATPQQEPQASTDDDEALARAIAGTPNSNPCHVQFKEIHV